MVDTRYIRVLRQAYFLEILGEAAYQQGSRKLRDGVALRKWHAFAETEVQMQRLLHQELQRITGDWRPSRSAIRLVRGLGRLAGTLNLAFLGLIIKGVLSQRHYARWAAQFNSENPRLWQTLVEHEFQQADHFERRKT